MRALYSTFSSTDDPEKPSVLPAEVALKKNDDKTEASKYGEGDTEYEGASVSSVASNLWNTIMGGGISLLALPSAAQSSGLAMFPIIVVVCGITTIYSADLLVLGCSRTQATGYSTFIRASLGYGWSYICDILLFFFLLGTCASLAEAMPSAISPVLGACPILICAAIAVIVSLAMSLGLPNLDAMSPFSQAAFWLTLLFLIYVVVDSSLDLSQPHPAIQIPYWPSSFMGFFNAVSQVSYSWLCHYNVIPIYHEMREPKRAGWIFALPMAIIASMICFLVAGILALLTHPTSDQTIFVQYAGTIVGKILSFGFGLCFVLSMPLYQWVGARSALSLFSSLRSFSEENAVDSESLIAPSGKISGEPDTSSLKIMHIVWACLTFLFVALVKNLDNVITIISAVAAVPIMFIMPPLAWAYIGPEDTDRGLLHSVTVAYVVTVFGFALWFGCLYSLESL